MKLEGHDLSRESVELVPIPRGYDKETGEKIPDITFVCQKVKSYKEFDALCKMPQPPKVVKKGGVEEKNFDDETYKAKMTKHNRARYDYVIIKSLAATPGLEWETIKFADQNTWSNWEQELEDAGFTQAERGMIQDGVLKANSVTNQRMQEALANFLRGQVKA